MLISVLQYHLYCSYHAISLCRPFQMIRSRFSHRFEYRDTVSPIHLYCLYSLSVREADEGGREGGREEKGERGGVRELRK